MQGVQKAQQLAGAHLAQAQTRCDALYIGATLDVCAQSLP